MIECDLAWNYSTGDPCRWDVQATSEKSDKFSRAFIAQTLLP